MKKTALIMAGGRGERFWPRSRKNLPKQFLSLTGDGKTMLQLTVERIRPLVALEDVFIATNEAYRSLVLAQLPGLPQENILCEPVGRNTAPCIGLGAVHIRKKYGDAIMLVLPSDHLIRCNDIFVDTLSAAAETAETGRNLVTLGITPNYPETGYGYIRYDAQLQAGRAYAVERFVEKPDYPTAKKYLEEECYLWNSGMFIWKVSSILSEIADRLPEMMQGLDEIAGAIATPQQQEVLERVFPGFASESIDYAIMEKAQSIYTIPGSFGWDDVGSWLAVGRIRENDAYGNVIAGNVEAVDCWDSILEGKEKLIAAVGVRNLIVVDTDDATLICDKAHAGEIKKILERLREKGSGQYL